MYVEKKHEVTGAVKEYTPPANCDTAQQLVSCSGVRFKH